LSDPHPRHLRYGLDAPHALAAHFRLDDFHAALVTHDPAVLHPLVLAAVALPVLGGTEDLGAEQAVLFGLEGPIVDGLRLLHLAVGPRTDLLWRGQTNADRVERHALARLLKDCGDSFHANTSLKTFKTSP